LIAAPFIPLSFERGGAGRPIDEEVFAFRTPRTGDFLAIKGLLTTFLGVVFLTVAVFFLEFMFIVISRGFV
jgi:hypothetical protein